MCAKSSVLPFGGTELSVMWVLENPEPGCDDTDYGETLPPTAPPVQLPDRGDDSGYDDIAEDGETEYEDGSDYEAVSDCGRLCSYTV